MRVSRPDSSPLRESHDLRDVLDEAVRVSGYAPDQIMHDHWISCCLYGVSKHLPSDGWLGQTPDRKAVAKGLTRREMPKVARWAFAGGTSLSAAWQVVERFSEDLDSNLFRAHNTVSKNALRVVRRLVTSWASEEIGATRRSGGAGSIQITALTAPDGSTLNVDSAIHSPDPAETLTDRRVIHSIIGRALPDLESEYPEIGGFELPVVVVPFTAVNKLDALHRRAEGGNLRALRARIRDVLDLACIARSHHAKETRRRVPDLVGAMTVGFGHKAPRPENGYGHSPAFEPGTLAYEALRDAYVHRLEGLVPTNSKLPDFEETVELIRELDYY